MTEPSLKQLQAQLKQLANDIVAMKDRRREVADAIVARLAVFKQGDIAAIDPPDQSGRRRLSSYGAPKAKPVKLVQIDRAVNASYQDDTVVVRYIYRLLLKDGSLGVRTIDHREYDGTLRQPTDTELDSIPKPKAQ